VHLWEIQKRREQNTATNCERVDAGFGDLARHDVCLYKYTILYYELWSFAAGFVCLQTLYPAARQKIKCLVPECANIIGITKRERKFDPSIIYILPGRDKKKYLVGDMKAMEIEAKTRCAPIFCRTPA